MAKRQEPQIKIATGNFVRINCPNADKFPAFHAAFHGRSAKVFAVEPKGARDVVTVELLSGGSINVHRDWLSHAKAA